MRRHPPASTGDEVRSRRYGDRPEEAVLASLQNDASRSPIKVLIVEDLRSDAVLVSAMLSEDRHDRFACDWVTTLAQAREKVTIEEFDCVLLDMNLPDSQGLQTLFGMQEAAANPAVVVLTGIDDAERAEAAVAAGAQDFLTKGRIDGRQLADAIRHAIERKNIYDELAQRELEDRTAIVDLRSALDALSDSENRYRIVLSALEEGVILFDREERISTFNESALRILGLSGDELRRLSARDAMGLMRDDGTLLPLDESPPVRARMTGLPQREIVGVHRRDGELVWLDVTCNPQWNAQAGRCDEVVMSFVDVTERRQLERRLHEQALHDALTGLPNRVLLMDRVQAAIDRTNRSALAFAVLFIDIDRFKAINDSFGHDAGDAVLVEAAQRFRSTLRPQDTLARIGGDEMVAVCEDLGAPTEAEDIAARLARVLERPFDLGEVELVVTASIGIVTSRAGVSPDELLRHADHAMYRAKGRGRARVDVYDEVLAARALEQVKLEANLRDAVSHGGLDLDYLPVVDLRSHVTVAAEALLRRVTPHERSLPANFIETAEASALILPIGAWVLRKACFDLRSLVQQGRAGPSLSVAVNVSARQVAQRDFRDVVDESLRRSGLHPSNLWLELTESILIESDASTIGALRELKEVGVRLAIDDFGTGYSSLTYLRRLPIDMIKIDRSFVAGICHDPSDRSIVAAVINLGASLDLEVVAEGVETREQAELLVELGCPFGQGFYYSRPTPISELGIALGRP